MGFRDHFHEGICRDCNDPFLADLRSDPYLLKRHLSWHKSCLSDEEAASKQLNTKKITMPAQQTVIPQHASDVALHERAPFMFIDNHPFGLPSREMVPLSAAK